MPIASLKPLRKTAPQQRQQHQGDGYLLTVEELRHQRVLDNVGGGVR